MPAHPRLLFISNLFPDAREPYRGLDNATVLHHLADRWEIRALAVRPTLPFRGSAHTPREIDAVFAPRYVAAPYVPKIGSRVNHRLMARALRGPVREVRREFPFDAVLSSWIYPDSCAVARLAAELEFPFVAIAQGSDVHQYLRDPVRRRIIAEALPRAAAIITRSAELARLLAEAGLAPGRLHPVYNGIDFTRFSPAARNTVRAGLGLPPDVPTILFVGNFYAIKNPLLLIEAHAQLCTESALAGCRLVMLGGGPLVEEARALADRLGFGPQVVLAGRQDADAVARYMQAADVLALPSDNEGVPNVILEAFASGLPVVASRVGGIPEVHAGDFLGRLATPRDLGALTDALRDVLTAPPALGPIREHALQFSWERAATAYHELLLRACR